MKIWILGLLILGAALSVVNAGENDDDEYEVKRFHVQSREMGGSPTCFETRRKRSTSEPNGVRDTHAAAPAEDEEELRASAGPRGTDSVSGILVQDAGSLGNAGVLVIRNQAGNTPILFELRPVDTDSTDMYYEDNDGNSPDALNADDDEDNKDTANDENSEEVADESGNKENRYKPSADVDNDSGEDEETTVKRRRARPTRKRKRKPSNGYSSLDTRKPSKKRKIISNLPTKRRPNRRRNQSQKKIRKTNKRRKPTKKRNQNKTRRRRPSKKRYESVSSDSDRRRYQSRAKGNTYNRHKFGNSQDSNFNRLENIGDNVYTGSGEKAVARTMSTTHTGTAADVNCIIITKEATPTTQRPFGDTLGRSAADSEDKSFGHRKRFGNRVQFAYA